MLYTDAQATFNKITDHLARQKERAKEGWRCRLRAPNLSAVGGPYLQCAVGCLIPDKDYLKAFELDSGLLSPGERAPGEGSFGAWLEENIGRNLRPLLIDLQAIHDDQPTKGWGESLARLALGRGLKFDAEDFQRKFSDPGYVTQGESQ